MFVQLTIARRDRSGVRVQRVTEVSTVWDCGSGLGLGEGGRGELLSLVDMSVPCLLVPTS